MALDLSKLQSDVTAQGALVAQVQTRVAALEDNVVGRRRRLARMPAFATEFDLCQVDSVPSVDVCARFFSARGGRSTGQIRGRPVRRRLPGSSKASKRPDHRERERGAGAA